MQPAAAHLACDGEQPNAEQDQTGRLRNRRRCPLGRCFHTCAARLALVVGCPRRSSRAYGNGCRQNPRHKYPLEMGEVPVASHAGLVANDMPTDGVMSRACNNHIFIHLHALTPDGRIAKVSPGAALSLLFRVGP